MCVALAGTVVAADQTKDPERAERRAMARETLARLDRVQPSARAVVEPAAGYAAFSNFGMKLGLAGGGGGKGLAVNNRTRQETFMKMGEVQAGLGLGIKEFRLVWVFETPEALDHFATSGWELGGQGTAGAKVGETGEPCRALRRWLRASGSTSLRTTAWPWS